MLTAALLTIAFGILVIDGGAALADWAARNVEGREREDRRRSDQNR